MIKKLSALAAVLTAVIVLGGCVVHAHPIVPHPHHHCHRC